MECINYTSLSTHITYSVLMPLPWNSLRGIARAEESPFAPIQTYDSCTLHLSESCIFFNLFLSTFSKTPHLKAPTPSLLSVSICSCPCTQFLHSPSLWISYLFNLFCQHYLRPLTWKLLLLSYFQSPFALLHTLNTCTLHLSESHIFLIFFVSNI